MPAPSKACYRKLRRYKYQLVADYPVSIGLAGFDIETEYISLSPGGELTIRKSYAWDGPSGPTIDTRTFMRGSLVHDALYQLMRTGQLDSKKHRDFADRLLRRMCLQDGMWSGRAWWVYWGVRLFGRLAAARRDTPPDAVTCVP